MGKKSRGKGQNGKIQKIAPGSQAKVQGVDENSFPGEVQPIKKEQSFTQRIETFQSTPLANSTAVNVLDVENCNVSTLVKPLDRADGNMLDAEHSGSCPSEGSLASGYEVTSGSYVSAEENIDSDEITHSISPNTSSHTCMNHSATETPRDSGLISHDTSSDTPSVQASTRHTKIAELQMMENDDPLKSSTKGVDSEMFDSQEATQLEHEQSEVLDALEKVINGSLSCTLSDEDQRRSRPDIDEKDGLENNKMSPDCTSKQNEDWKLNAACFVSLQELSNSLQHESIEVVDGCSSGSQPGETEEAPNDAAAVSGHSSSLSESGNESNCNNTSQDVTPAIDCQVPEILDARVSGVETVPSLGSQENVDTPGLNNSTTFPNETVSQHEFPISREEPLRKASSPPEEILQEHASTTEESFVELKSPLLQAQAEEKPSSSAILTCDEQAPQIQNSVSASILQVEIVQELPLTEGQAPHEAELEANVTHTEQPKSQTEKTGKAGAVEHGCCTLL